MSDEELRAISDAVAKVRRSGRHVAGTRNEEALRAVVRAACNGAPLVVVPELEAGKVALILGQVCFHSDAALDSFVAALVARQGPDAKR